MSFWRIFLPKNAFEKNTMFLQISFIAKKAISSILFPLPKTERKKGFQKEKRQKINEKNRKNFLQFFPVDSLPLFHKKELYRKGNRIHSFSHPLFPNKKK